MSSAPPTHIYLSPHLDDAVFSCGGMIHQQTQAGERVIVVTICAGGPPVGPFSEFAQSLHERWQTPLEAVAVRRAEDLAALSGLGAEGIHLSTPDCIYRVQAASGAHLYASEEALFGEVHLSELNLIRRMADETARLLRTFPRPHLYAPLGLGHHVDHQLTRQAAEVAGRVHAYFEDYPYVERTREETRAALESKLALELIYLTPADLEAKVQAIAAYASQLSSFWEDGAAMEAAIRDFAGRVGAGRPAERLWRTR
jgi:LmbE family N-acetylglucosaminyl deacetylase